MHKTAFCGQSKQPQCRAITNPFQTFVDRSIWKCGHGDILCAADRYNAVCRERLQKLHAVMQSCTESIWRLEKCNIYAKMFSECDPWKCSVGYFLMNWAMQVQMSPVYTHSSMWILHFECISQLYWADSSIGIDIFTQRRAVEHALYNYCPLNMLYTIIVHWTCSIQLLSIEHATKMCFFCLLMKQKFIAKYLVWFDWKNIM